MKVDCTDDYSHSGMAWAYSKQPNDIKVITNWDSHNWGDYDQWKAPTEIAYGASSSESAVAKKSTTNSTDDIIWGYDIGEAESVK